MYTKSIQPSEPAAQQQKTLSQWPYHQTYYQAPTKEVAKSITQTVHKASLDYLKEEN